ncbi:MAG TPA: bifunctional YncE family protein/alkaline phosphatase family protein [Terriglobia bacterium]|nr:bifunctional YncE family protein/alkaline phosphatase family protein [Terriglobia bacterium]
MKNVPGKPQPTNSFPAAMALSPDGRYLAVLNDGYGTAESGHQQSIAVIGVKTNRLTDYPDSRLGRKGRQTYFLGLGFSPDGRSLYASVASLTDLTGSVAGDTGNGIAVYSFHDGRPTPQRFIKIPPQSLRPAQRADKVSERTQPGEAVPYPAGLAVVVQNGKERILVADNLSDDALLLDAQSGDVIHRFDLSTHDVVPAAFPYGVIATRDGKRGYCSLWNASQVAELDLGTGTVTRHISLLEPETPTAAGSHPTAMLLSPDEKYLYVALANRDRVAVIRAATGELAGFLNADLPGDRHGGVYPNALAQTGDGARLYVADASADAVAVFDMTQFKENSTASSSASPQTATGFIPTEWYPTALALEKGDLFIATGKGKGTGPNGTIPAGERKPGSDPRKDFPYIAGLIHGSVARIRLAAAEGALAKLTDEVIESNRMKFRPGQIHFQMGSNPIRHVIYIIKENRSFDQILGDIKHGNGDPALCMYGNDITPNEHKLALQFGVLDNFYDSGEVSGDGHVWSTAAITSDYTEKTWEISYRGAERLYDYEGVVSKGVPWLEGQADVNEPGTGYIWSNVARAGLTHRNYGEFVATEWCRDSSNPQSGVQSPKEGTPEPQGNACTPAAIHKGEPLPANVGDPKGSASPWPWAVPMISRDVATKPELEGHFDPRFPDFELLYPDQLRADEFLNEFDGFVEARKKNQGTELPQFVILRLPDDHTAGTRPKSPQPAASIADNDLAVGRVVEAVSHSPYWDDTAIFILEDDAQDGPDHVDAHRSIAFVISKYSPGSTENPFVDHHFYTTVSVVHSIETLLGLPPMNNNDAWAPVMAPLFAGPGNQPAFKADYTNRDNGVIYRVNAPNAPGAKQSAAMDFSHADAADTPTLNAILWKDRKGNQPMPKTPHKRIQRRDD